jgi:ferredoxin-type protein NapG
MKRRDFFKAGAGRAARALVGVLDDKAESRAESWIRPPFARRELDFLLTCTRCDDCIAACPHQVIFKLPAKLGVQVVGTPVLDLANKGCHLCADWPCVAACEADALRLPDDEDGGEAALEAPQLALARIDTSSCLPYAGPECGACAHVCPLPGALTWQGAKPVINPEICNGCALCREACITEPKSVIIATIKHGEDNAVGKS